MSSYDSLQCHHCRCLRDLLSLQIFEAANATAVSTPASQAKPAQQRQQVGSKAASAHPSSKPAQAQASKPAPAATQPQVPKAQHATAVPKSVPQASNSPSAVLGQSTKSARQAEAMLSPQIPTSGAHPRQAVKPLQLAKAASKPVPQHPQATSPKADALPAAATERSLAKASQAVAAPAVTDEWADKGVPVQSGYLQSGYQMADSPLPEEEDLVSEHETSRPPSTERQQVDLAHPELAPAQVQVAKAAATNKEVAPSVAPSKVQSSKDTLPEKVLLTTGKDGAKSPSGGKAPVENGNPSKQPPTRQSSSATAAAVNARPAATAARSTPPGAGTSPLVDKKDQLAGPSSGVSRLQAQPAEPGRVSKSPQLPGAKDPSPSRPKQAAQPPSSSAKVPSSAAAQGKPASGKAPSSSEKPDRPSRQVPLPASSLQQPAAVVHPKTAPAVATEPSTKMPIPSPQPDAATLKPSAPRQSSAALSGKQASAVLSPPPTSKVMSSKPQLPSSSSAVVRPEQKQSGAPTGALAQAAQSPVASAAQPPLPDSKRKASRRTSLHIPLQASPQEPPIPGLASPEGVGTLHGVLPQPAAALPSLALTAAGQSEPLVSEPLSPWVPPPPAEAPPQPPQIPSDPYPPEPSSPRPAPAVGDSGEDMEIDEEPARESLPPLPTEPFPVGFELATIDSNQELMEISGEERDSLLNELSGIHVSYLYCNVLFCSQLNFSTLSCAENLSASYHIVSDTDVTKRFRPYLECASSMLACTKSKTTLLRLRA